MTENQMTKTHQVAASNAVQVVNLHGRSSVVLVCEHASAVIPQEFDGLGLAEDVRQSHIAWDPGAMPVAKRLAQVLDARLVAGGVSRLIYDCNRPPSAVDAMPERSEIFDIPGNKGLSPKARDSRVHTYYEPFRQTLHQVISSADAPIVVTVHSFTPTYHGQKRAVEIGILHDSDSRLADAMLTTAVAHTDFRVERNEPYGPEHGVTHTLREHALAHGNLNVMLEIRNDLIRTTAQQIEMADMVARWLVDASARISAKGTVQCAI